MHSEARLAAEWDTPRAHSTKVTGVQEASETWRQDRDTDFISLIYFPIASSRLKRHLEGSCGGSAPFFCIYWLVPNPSFSCFESQ